MLKESPAVFPPLRVGTVRIVCQNCDDIERPRRLPQVSRPDTLTVMIGGAAHVLIIVACGAGFLHLRPRGRQWGQFFGGGVLALAYFALIIAIAAPR